MELESTFTILKCLRISDKTIYYDKFSWVNLYRDSSKVDRRVARIKEVQSKEDSSQLLRGEEVRHDFSLVWIVF